MKLSNGCVYKAHAIQATTTCCIIIALLQNNKTYSNTMQFTLLDGKNTQWEIWKKTPKTILDSIVFKAVQL